MDRVRLHCIFHPAGFDDRRLAYLARGCRASAFVSWACGSNRMIKARYFSPAAVVIVGTQLLFAAHATEPFLEPGLQAKIDAAARAAIGNGTAAGIAVGVVRGGQLVFNRGYGSANLELDVPVNNST